MPTVGTDICSVGLGDMAIAGLKVMAVEDGASVGVARLGEFVCGMGVSVSEGDPVGGLDRKVTFVDGLMSVCS